jgi:hypothetical protein
VILDLPPFRPRFPWWGGDLQTLASFLRPPPKDLTPHTSREFTVDLRDGTGDRLACTLDRPSVEVAGKPLTILIHGLTGSQESSYIISMARCLLDAGGTRAPGEPARRGPVARNVRGAVLCRPQRGSPRPAGEPSRWSSRERASAWSATRWEERCCSSISARRAKGLPCWPPRRSAPRSTFQPPAAGCWSAAISSTTAISWGR